MKLLAAIWSSILLPVLASVLLLASVSQAGVASPAWNDVDQLASEQKYQKALEAADGVLSTARQSGNTRVWTEALIRTTRLRLALHGYETAVHDLKAAEWPRDPSSRVLLNLYYAQALTHYLQAYHWDIVRRERVTSTGEPDLATWTLSDVDDEIGRAFDDVMKESSALEKAPPDFFDETLERNNFPRGVRPTLRDVVVYMAVRHFANTMYWTPRESSEIYRYDVTKLAQGLSTRRISAVDRARHPLEKISTWLTEHREFHRRAKRPEAALEAQYELFELLHRNMTDESDRAAIVKVLTDVQAAGRGSSWWARGQALLADLLRESNKPGRLIEVRDEAARGVKAYPDSVGGQMCAKIVHDVERPDYSVTAMRHDGPDRRSILINYKNIKKLYFRAYALDLENELATKKMPEEFMTASSFYAVPPRADVPKPASEWVVELQPTPDFVHHRKFVTPVGLKKHGAYVIVVSSRADFSARDNVVQAVRLMISDLVLATKVTQSTTIEAQVLTGEKGSAVTGATVSLYRYAWNARAELVETKTSDGDGSVQFREPKKAASEYWHYFLVARKGSETALELERLYFGRVDTNRRRDTTALIAVDRAIYRVGQKVFWKLMVFEGTPGQYKSASAGSMVTVGFQDPNGQEAASKIVKLGAFGTASGEFVIPPGRPLGDWRISADKPGGAQIVRVEDYKRPTFEPILKETTEPLRLNRRAKLEGEAKYYYGLPVTQGTVSWRVQRQEVWATWMKWSPYVMPFGREETIASGTSAVKADGTFAIEFTPKADERLGQAGQAADPRIFRFLIEADITDDGGETRSVSRAIRLGFVAVEAEIADAKSYHRADEPVRLPVTLRNLDGQPQAGSAKFRLLRLKAPATASLPADIPREAIDGLEPSKFPTADDRKRARWETDINWRSIVAAWDEGDEVAAGPITHDEKGAGEISVPAVDAGVYRLQYETQDAFGATYRQSRPLLVAPSEKNRATLPFPLLAQVQNSTMEVGKKAKFFVQSGFAKQTFAIETFRAGHRIARRIWTAGKDPNFFEIPITKEDRGGFTVVVSGVRDHQLLREELAVAVPWTDRSLKIEYATFRDSIRPGATERFRLTVKDFEGKPLAAGVSEVLALMYDRSLDLFGPLQNPNPLDLYPIRLGSEPWNYTLAVQPGIYLAGMYPKGPEVVVLREDAMKFHTSYGVGGPGRRGGFGEMRLYKGSIEDAPMAMAPKSFASESDAASDKVSEKTEMAKGGSLKDVAPAKAIPTIRKNFAETAFFKPHLINGKDGSVSFEFTAPESVTSWNVLAYALTKDLRAGFLSRETKTVKDIMVRTNAPRFLREGDLAEVKVVLSNATRASIQGNVEFDIEDAETEKSASGEFGLKPSDLAKPFKVAKDGTTTFRFALKTPKRVGTFAFKVVAKTDGASDGERQVFPVLPGRVHLAQSRFVALKNQAKKTLVFEDMATADATRVNEKVVVNVDAQLLYGVLRAMPYLLTSPYENTEQSLNRFLATGVLSSLFKKYPAIASLGRQLSSRKTEVEAFDAPDANRRMSLEESPWLEQARGGRETKDLARVLDPKQAQMERESALQKLRKAQLPGGAFSWFPGGPPDPYMTLYALLSFGRALEYDIAVPKEMVTGAWSYTRTWLDGFWQMALKDKCCAESITLLSYVISLYPDASWSGGLFDADLRKRLLDFAFQNWRDHSPLLKSYLALSLKRAGRSQDAKLVWDAVMDSAKTDDQLGTYWAPEARSWLWYNDTIETQALALRTLLELDPQDTRADGIAQWLFLNKKLNQWKSTRATAEVVYALVHYLQSAKTLNVKETISVEAGPRKERWVFEPGKYSDSKNQIALPGEAATKDLKIAVEKSSPGLAFASATWHFSTAQPPKDARGDFFSITRRYFKRELATTAAGKDWVLKPMTAGEKIRAGDQVEVQLTIASKHEAEYVHVRDPRAAGFEPESLTSGYRWDMGISLYEEVRDSGTNFFFMKLPVGQYTMKYRVRANMTGTFKIAPATIQSFYAPEFNAYSGSDTLTIN